MSFKKLAVLAAIGFGALNFGSTFASNVGIYCASCDVAEPASGFCCVAKPVTGDKPATNRQKLLTPEEKLERTKEIFKKHGKDNKNKPEFYLYKVCHDDGCEDVRLMFSLSHFFSTHLKSDFNDDDFFENGPECLGFQLIDKETGATLKILPHVSDCLCKYGKQYLVNNFVIDFIYYDCVAVNMPTKRDVADSVRLDDIYRDENFEFVPGRTYALKVFKYDLEGLKAGKKGKLVCKTDVKLDSVKKNDFGGISDRKKADKYRHPEKFNEQFFKRYIEAQQRFLFG